MHSLRLSPFTVSLLVIGALAVSSVLIIMVAAESYEAILNADSAAGPGREFAATTAHCQAEDVHTWAYPAGYIRGQQVVCDVLSDEPRIQGRLTLHAGCAVKSITKCEAKFRIDAESGARWEGSYRIAMPHAGLHAEGRSLDGSAGAQIVFDIYDLDSGDGWGDAYGSGNVSGRIIGQ